MVIAGLAVEAVKFIEVVQEDVHAVLAKYRSTQEAIRHKDGHVYVGVQVSKHTFLRIQHHARLATNDVYVCVLLYITVSASYH